jgi:hypothetical protein
MDVETQGGGAHRAVGEGVTDPYTNNNSIILIQNNAEIILVLVSACLVSDYLSTPSSAKCALSRIYTSSSVSKPSGSRKTKPPEQLEPP